MERRTHQELLSEVRDLLDIAETPYFSDAQVAAALNQEYMDWFKGVASGAESDEEKRRTLAPLERISPATIPVNGKVDLLKLNPRPFRILSVEASYDACNANRPAKPLSVDARRVAERDPFNAPYVIEPAYVENGSQLEILPAPASVLINYLVRPEKIDPAKPTDRTLAEYETQSRLIERAAARLAIPQENVGVYQALTAESQTTT